VPPRPGCPGRGPAYPEVTRAICLVPSAWFPQAPRYALPFHLCRFRVRSICQGCFQDPLPSHPNPVRDDTLRGSSPLAGRGMFAPFPSATAFALALGAGSPCADRPCAGTLGLPAGGVLALLRATHVRILASRASTGPRGPASPAWGTLRYRAPRGAPAASAGGLSPATFSPRDG
jgi:hypothetical protein